MKLLVDSSTLSFKVQITDIEEELYGAEVNIYFDGLNGGSIEAEDGRSIIQSIGTIAEQDTWTSDSITHFQYYDFYTGNAETHYFLAATTYSLQCNAKPLDGSVYLIGAQALEFDASDAGAKPIISKFSISQTKLGEKKAEIFYKVRNAYDGEDEESFRTIVRAYVDGKRKTGINPIGKEHEGSFIVAFDDFGTYDVYIMARNISWTAKDDFLLDSDPSETITISIKDVPSILDCQIVYSIISRKDFSTEMVEAYVDNYIDITGDAWQTFCDAINVVRASVGLSEATFTSGDTLSAIMWNEAMEAFADAADELSCIFDTDKFSASRGMPITKALIDEVNSEIAAILEEIT